MPKKLQQKVVQCQYFVWRFGTRSSGVFYADGRCESNKAPLGRISLGTKDEAEAYANLRRADLKLAVQHGFADRSLLDLNDEKSLALDEGIAIYFGNISGPAVIGGARKATVKRYKAVADKFLRFAKSKGVLRWPFVTTQVLKSYAEWLAAEGYAFRTTYLELTCLKQMIRFLIDEGKLPPSCKIRLPLRKAEGTPTYAYSEEEVQAMIVHCLDKPELQWLGRLIVILAYTGMRIGEAAQLEWKDIDLQNLFISVVDESRGGGQLTSEQVRTTKTHRSRRIPIHRQVKATLESIPGPHVGRVFAGPLGGALKPDTIRIVLQREVLAPLARKFVKLGAAKGFIDGRLHSFRHFFCSTCFRSGIAEADIKLWLGHSDSKMVAHYRHLADGEHQRAIDKIKTVGSPDAM